MNRYIDLTISDISDTVKTFAFSLGQVEDVHQLYKNLLRFPIMIFRE